MPLQNRVDPSGTIFANDARGLFTGNRGAIHDPQTRTLLKRRWSTKAWIICDCGFKDRKREVFGRNSRTGGAGWTNLFFLDEVTALAAGHRPCFECRRQKAKEYADCFGKAFAIARPTVRDMDERLHNERFASSRTSRPLVSPIEIDRLPDGTVLRADNMHVAKSRGELLTWRFTGYAGRMSDSVFRSLEIVTPATTIAVLRAGYEPVWHTSAMAGDQVKVD